jgi:hypothetical protein
MLNHGRGEWNKCARFQDLVLEDTSKWSNVQIWLRRLQVVAQSAEFDSPSQYEKGNMLGSWQLPEPQPRISGIYYGCFALALGVSHLKVFAGLYCYSSFMPAWKSQIR